MAKTSTERLKKFDAKLKEDVKRDNVFKSKDRQMTLIVVSLCQMLKRARTNNQRTMLSRI